MQRALAARDQQVEVLGETIADLERELRSKRGQIRRLKADHDRQLKNHPKFDVAMRVLDFWRRTCSPNARELGGVRLQNVLARLDGNYTEEMLCRSVEGYSLKPYVSNGRRSPNGAKDDWRADAELIFRGPQQVDQGIRIAEQADVLRSVAPVSDSSPVMRPTSVKGLSELGEAALRFAKHGWMVFPCRPREKAPATPRGLLEAKNDPGAIVACWSRHPNLNVAVRTGQESGLLVLDVDGDDGLESLHELEKVHSPLPKTLSIKTPRGGQHFYFLHPGVEVRNTTGFPAPGLDVRGDGGYVLAPPSIHPNGNRYELDEPTGLAPIPMWLLDLLLKRQTQRGERKPAEHWGKVASNGTREGSRDATLTSYAGHLASLGMEEPELRATAQMWNMQNVKPPLPGAQVDKVIDSIFRMKARA